MQEGEISMLRRVKWLLVDLLLMVLSFLMAYWSVSLFFEMNFVGSAVVLVGAAVVMYATTEWHICSLEVSE